MIHQEYAIQLKKKNTKKQSGHTASSMEAEVKSVLGFDS